MTTIRDAINDPQFNKETRAAAGRLTAMGYGDVGIRSGYRSPSKNKSVGGAKYSQHMNGAAMDIAGATGWSNEKRAAFHAAAQAAGFKGHGFYGTGAIHIDTGPQRSWGPNKNAAWARAALRTAPVIRPMADVANVAPALSLPDSMSAPMSFATANDISARNQAADALSQHFGAPNIGFGATGVSPAYSAPFGKVDRAPLGALQPSQERYGPVSSYAVPTPSVPASPADAYAGARAPTSMEKIGNFASRLTGIDPTAGLVSPPSRFEGGINLDHMQRISMPISPAGLYAEAVAPTPPSSLASAYGQLGSTLQQAGVNLAGMPRPPTDLTQTAMTPPTPPQQIMAPPLAPQALPPIPPPVEVRQYPVFQPPPAPPPSLSNAFPSAPEAPPSLSVGDVYGGAVGQARANDGSIVGRNEFSTTTISNPMGATTAMNGGYQSAYGPGPNLGGLGSALGNGIGGLGKMALGLSPNQSLASQKKELTGRMLGSLLGGALLGLPGALAGGFVGGRIGQKNDFPDAPSNKNDRSGVPGGARNERERASISPAAAGRLSRDSSVTGLW